jgi:hypothetical protein
MLLPSLLVACAPQDPSLTVYAAPADAAVLSDAVRFLGDPRVTLEERDDPSSGVGRSGREQVTVAVARDLTCGECFRVDHEAEGQFVVHGGSALGVQYGVADVLERHGWRFFHPWRTVLPATLTLLDDEGLGVTEEPEQTIRGLDPHTLHPIEALFDLWVPSDQGLDGSRRLIDWLVKNRGNHLQWPGLDNIVADPAQQDAWRAHTATIVNYAHDRGVRVGLGIQLFGTANLQQAYDLLDDANVDVAQARSLMDERIAVVTRDLPFDAVNLSFGEFSGEDPERFIEMTNLATERVLAALPDAEVSAVIHVGDTEATRVDHEGQNVIYYFLVQWADPRIVPYIHTVMYYNLFEDAGGAYHHEDFSEHRDYLFDRLEAGAPVVYFPESAYWVAFDVCVPTYLPIYVFSRWKDLQGIQDAGHTLPAHVLFSSGWEWGYWQNDVATLRMGWHLPTDWRDLYRDLFQPWGQPDIAEAIADLAELQHQALLVDRLAPWMAGREAVMDLGRSLDIVSQPDRPTFDDIAALPPDERASFRTVVVDGLFAHADGTAGVRARFEAADGDDRWLAELRDGAAVDEHRARYMAHVLDAVLAYADGFDPLPALSAAESELSLARSVVERRHTDLHDPDGADLVRDVLPNPTIYDYGYLAQGHTLCFWERERAQVRNLVLGAADVVPACVL